MAELDRRSFLTGAAAGGLALAAGTELDAPAVAKAVRAACRPRRPIPRSIFQAVRGHVFGRNTPGFASAARVFNTVFDGVRPKWVARPVDTADVRNAVRWAVKNHVRMRARSGGHSYAGYSTLNDGLVLDLRKLDRITVNRRARTATIGAGAQVLNVYLALARSGATIPGGSCPSVGIAGLALGGGMGLAGRAFGLTVDNILELEIVTADGCIRTVSKHSEPELFWALRGAGGGNFGIVTQFKFRIHPVPRAASWVLMSWPWSQASAAVAAWQAWQPTARDQFTSVLHLEVGRGTPRVVMTGQYLGPPGDVLGLVSPLRGVPGASLSFGQQDYFGLQMRWAGCSSQSFASCHTVGTFPGGTQPRETFRGGSDYVKRPLSGAGRAAMIRAIEFQQNRRASGALLLDSYGGAINRVKPSATAFVHRDALFSIQYFTMSTSMDWVTQTRAAMRPFVSGSCYQNYIDATLKDWQRAYYGANYNRLKAVRRMIDPDHVFNFPQAIGR